MALPRYTYPPVMEQFIWWLYLCDRRSQAGCLAVGDICAAEQMRGKAEIQSALTGGLELNRFPVGLTAGSFIHVVNIPDPEVTGRPIEAESPGVTQAIIPDLATRVASNKWIRWRDRIWLG